MNQLQQQADFSFSYQESNLGVFVEGINDVLNDTNKNLFWMYKINGEDALVGITEYQIKEGDVIDWEYRDISSQ
jgi:hypothetical protein